MNYLWAFVVGGTICVVGQLLIDYTKLSPARILTGYVVAGVILSAVGLYDPLAKLAGAGASVPLLGFGHLLAQGVVKAVDEIGLPGVFTGGHGRSWRSVLLRSSHPAGWWPCTACPAPQRRSHNPPPAGQWSG
jgi:stage V sporulation protein AE